MLQELRLALLGGLQITQSGAPMTGFISSKVQALLCYLAVTGRPHLRPALAGLLWGEMAEDKANANLRKALSNLNKLLPEHLLLTQHSVALDNDSAHWLDVEAFRQAVTGALPGGSSAIGAGTDLRPTPEVITALAQAMALYQGEFLSGFHVRDALAFEEWVLTQREQLRELALQALHILVEHHAARGENTQGIAYATRLLALDPWREEAHRQVMLLLARNGRRSAALAQYEACRQVLAEELGVEPMAETTALYERICAASIRRLNLPAQPTPFVGREDELAQIAQLFDDPSCRLLTLVGPGGIGKSRLALELARARRNAFLDGIYFVPLVGIDTHDLLVSAIADSLCFSFYGRQDAASQILDYLREKEILLLLDGFEYLLARDGPGGSDGSELLAQILDHAPRGKLLITSRQRLNLRWEWLYDVQGLSCPPETEATPDRACGAVQLFVQAASRVQPGFALTDEWPAVARICRGVEGMPLALELAAAAIRSRSCQEIAQEIEQDLNTLATSMRDMPERHRSLRAAFEGSWRLLDSEEQRVMRALSISRGGFPRQAAGSVAGASRTVLDALVEKSLLRRASRGRYDMHEPLRQFALAKLAAIPEEKKKVRARHRDYYADLMQSWQDLLQGEGQQDTLAEMAQEIENVRLAWKHAVDGQHDDAVSRSMESLYRFYETRGWFQEGNEAFALAAAAWQGATHPGARQLLARLQIRQALFSFRSGHYTQARELASTSLESLRRQGDPREEALALSILGSVAEEQGEYAQARERYERCLALYQEARDRRGQARTFDHLGDVARMVGQYDEAREHYQRSLTLYQEMGDRAGIASALNSLGSDAGIRGEYDQARAYFEQSLALRRELDDRFGIAAASHNLSAVAYLLGDYQAARDLRQEVLSICREIGFRWGVADALRHLGDTYRRLGQHQEARFLYEESLLLKRELGHLRGVALVLSSLGNLETAAGHYGPARQHLRQALETALQIESPPVALAILVDWVELLALQGENEQALELVALVLNHPATEKQTRDHVAPMHSELEAAVPARTAAAAERRGRAQTLEAAAAALLA